MILYTLDIRTEINEGNKQHKHLTGIYITLHTCITRKMVYILAYWKETSTTDKNGTLFIKTYFRCMKRGRMLIFCPFGLHECFFFFLLPSQKYFTYIRMSTAISGMAESLNFAMHPGHSNFPQMKRALYQLSFYSGPFLFAYSD